jgi:hypothetical protein
MKPIAGKINVSFLNNPNQQIDQNHGGQDRN